MNIDREGGFYFFNVKSNYFGKTEYYIVSIYFIDRYMIYDIDPVPGKININEHLFKSKIENKALFKEKIKKGAYINGWSNNTNLGKWVAPITKDTNSVAATFIGHGFADYNDTRVKLSEGGLFRKKFFLEIDYLDGTSRLFVSKSEIKFYEV